MSSDTYSRFCPAARKIERRSVSHAQIQVALLGINAESRRSRNHRHLAFAATSLSKQVEVASTINFAFPSLIPSTILLDARLQPANATRIAHVSGDGSGMAKGSDCGRKIHDSGCRSFAKEHEQQDNKCDGDEDEFFSHSV